jgi:hypothetical protein
MKQSPELSRAQERMKPGVISRDGFLGRDRRSLVEILEEADRRVNALGLTHARIADRMEQLLHLARRGLGTTVTVDDRYEVRSESARGGLPCPWGHPGMYPKTNVFLTNRVTGDEVMGTALHVHMIREHGFYEGRGGLFHLDPDTLARTLGLHGHSHDGDGHLKA